MPLTGTGDALGSLIKTNIDGVLNKTDREAVFKAMGNAIISHLLSNGVSAVSVTSVAGVVPGGGSSGPGVGNLV